MTRAKKITLAVALLAALGFLLPPFVNANRFRKRLAASASGALGRSVTLGDVRVRLLPRPGFDIKDFVVGDDPAFSAEPLLRSEQVTATVRILSLWRGKFEIAELDFKYPSLNLVRNEAGDWNIESLLRYTSSLRAAPTSRVRPEASPRFPYIQADSGRINFKVLQEKKAHALVDTDFALWLESENQWNMRLEGRPMRTDANLNDTGILRAEGSMQRGQTLGKSLLQMHATLLHSQLGQLSTLLSGKDHGWRGGVDIDAIAKGTAEKLEVTSDARIADFRRYDIAGGEPVSMRTLCTGTVMRVNDSAIRQKYGSSAMLSDINCRSAIGTGEIALSGSSALAANPNYDLKFLATDIPVSTVAALMRKAKRNLPDDLVATGVLSGTFFVRKLAVQEPKSLDPTASGLMITGSGRVVDAQVSSKSLNSNVNIEKLNFGIDSATSAAALGMRLPRAKQLKISRPQETATTANQSGNLALRIDPFTAILGESDRVTCSGRIGSRDYSLQVAGEGGVAKLTAAAKTFGLGSRLPFATGHASFDISLDGSWAGFAAPTVSGSAHLQRVTAPLDGTEALIHVATADLSLTPTEITVQKLAATVSGTRTAVAGTIHIPRSCETASCPVQFDLQASEINFDDLNRILNPKFRHSSWSALGGKFLGAGNEQLSKLLQFDAVGRLSVNRLVMKSATANKVSALLELKHGVAELRNVQGELLGGRYSGSWSATFTGSEPMYSGRGTLEGLALPQLNTLTHTTIGSGVLARSALKVTLSGSDAATLRKTVVGQFSLDWKDGSISRGVLSEKSLQFSSWQAMGEISSQKLSVTSGAMQIGSMRYVTTGSASFTHDLDLRFVNPAQTFAITGTIETPLVSLRDTSTRLESASNGKDAKPSKTP